VADTEPSVCLLPPGCGHGEEPVIVPLRMLGGAAAVLVSLSTLGLPAGALVAAGQVGTFT
jgi:hypothetical protein